LARYFIEDLVHESSVMRDIDNSEAIKAKLEAIRSHVAVSIGLAETPVEASLHSQAVPKIAFVAAAQTYKTIGSQTVEANRISLVARIMSMGTLHKSFAVSGAICTVGGRPKSKAPLFTPCLLQKRISEKPFTSGTLAEPLKWVPKWKCKAIPFISVKRLWDERRAV
jgi:hypothetical protein